MITPINRVRQIAQMSRSGAFKLCEICEGYLPFSSLGSGNRTSYWAARGADWEMGTGVYSRNILTREIVHASSNEGAPVSWKAGTVVSVFASITEKTLPKKVHFQYRIPSEPLEEIAFGSGLKSKAWGR